jgi:D-alanine-D-alanine ligase
MPRKSRVIALIFGGRSAEHEVSLRSAASVFQALESASYEVLPIFITRRGEWYWMPAELESFSTSSVPRQNNRVVFSPDPVHRGLIALNSEGSFRTIKADVMFPVLHGPYGEDGTLQGLLEMANVPYVGCGVAASAVGMDKVLMKAAFMSSGLLVGPFFWFLNSEWVSSEIGLTKRAAERGLPVFVKPANLGSSVGISRVDDMTDFRSAVGLALRYDRKVLVEDCVVGRELEVSVLGNDEPKASLAGEVIPTSTFYDYEEKYLRDTAELVIPARLNSAEQALAADTAIRAFKAVDGSGLARVDMFLTPEGKMVVNEINTIPGFTSISMYPKLWEVTGISYGDLVAELVELAVERHKNKQIIETDRL